MQRCDELLQQWWAEDVPYFFDRVNQSVKDITGSESNCEHDSRNM